MPLLTTEDRLGTTIAGKYRLDRVLGEGGMGVVYAGYHLKLDLPVAVKFLHAQYSRSQEVIDRFLREARATSRLVHPNVVGVRDIDVAETDGSVYMVLELLTGESLTHLLERERVLSVEQTLPLILPVIDALQAAHDLGIIHRDIKPDNVFLSRAPDGRITPKVLDFGIAKLTSGGSNPSATATGAVMGTALYMAPEQAMGRTKEIGPCSDVWSTAVMTYECLTGGFPFDFEFSAEMNAMQAMMATLTAPLVPLVTKRPELGVLSDVLMRALDRNAATRTASMRELGEGLRLAASGVSPAAKHSRVVSRPPPAARVTTGPMEGQPPVVLAADPLSDEAKKRLQDSFAKTALPSGTTPPVSAPSTSGPAAAALQTGNLTPPTRSLAPFAVGAVVVAGLVIGGVLVGSMLNGGTAEPAPATTSAAPTVATPPPSAVPTEPVAPPPAAPTLEAAVEPPSPTPEAGDPARPGGTHGAARAGARTAGRVEPPSTATEEHDEPEATERGSARVASTPSEGSAGGSSSGGSSSGTPSGGGSASTGSSTSSGGSGSSGTEHRAGGLSAGEF